MAEETDSSLQQMLDQAVENERRRLPLNERIWPIRNFDKTRRPGKPGEPSCGNWMLH